MDEHHENLDPGAAVPQHSEESATPEASSRSSQTAPHGPGHSRWSVFWREWVRPLMIIALVMFSFRSAVADWNDVPTGSMKPTILNGDRIFINKVAYDLKFPFTTYRLAEWDDPEWGDIVVLRSPQGGKRLVKRVVGLPGDVVEVRNNELYLNGEEARYQELDEETRREIEKEMGKKIDRHAHHYQLGTEMVADREHAVMFSAAGNPSMSNYPATQVPEDCFFVMGDNRSNSADSRVFGPVHRSAILGRATAVALSVDPDRHYLPRWKRFFSRLR